MEKEIFTQSENFKKEYSARVCTVDTLYPIKGAD